MTISTVDRAAVPMPSRVGQGTAIEQSRAAAEVHAAVVVAQQVPRQVDVSLGQMRESCSRLRLAEKAFYRYPRGGQTVTGASVHLARELARCWGNIQYGIAELRRDDDHGQSEMQAWAWDVQTNARSSMIFVVPHKRDKRGGPPETLTELRDVYENNANMGARRLRESIFSVLPPWFVDEAKDLCVQTMEKGEGDKPLAQRIADAVRAYENIGVTVAQLEEKVGRPRSEWIAPDLAQLQIAFTSIRRGELRKDEEFPPARLTVEGVNATAAAAAAKHAAAVPDPAAEDPAPPGEPALPDEADRPVEGRVKRMYGLFGRHGMGERDSALAYINDCLDRSDIVTTKQLTKADTNTVIRHLEALAEPGPAAAPDQTPPAAEAAAPPQEGSP